MTIQEAHRQFKLFIDKVSSEAITEFTHSQIDVFIHEAEVRIIKQAYGRNNIYKQGYQEIQKRTDDLNTLVKTGYLAPRMVPNGEGFFPENIDGVYSFPLDVIYTTDSLEFIGQSEYMFYLRSQCKVTSNTIAPVYTGVVLVSQDSLTEAMLDPFNKSRISTPVIFFEDNCIKVDTNGGDFEPKAIRMTYLKYPTKVSWSGNVNSDLPEEKQREAIQLAVVIALEGIESARTQIATQLLNTQE